MGDEMVGLSSLLGTPAAETVQTRAAMRGFDWPVASIAAEHCDLVFDVGRPDALTMYAKLLRAYILVSLEQLRLPCSASNYVYVESYALHTFTLTTMAAW